MQINTDEVHDALSQCNISVFIFASFSPHSPLFPLTYAKHVPGSTCRRPNRLAIAPACPAQPGPQAAPSLLPWL
jgi:hypothetical protein